MTFSGFNASVSYIDCNRNLRDRHNRGATDGTVLFQIGHVL